MEKARTVRGLIKILQKLPPNALLAVNGPDGGGGYAMTLLPVAGVSLASEFICQRDAYGEMVHDIDDVSFFMKKNVVFIDGLHRDGKDWWHLKHDEARKK